MFVCQVAGCNLTDAASATKPRHKTGPSRCDIDLTSSLLRPTHGGSWSRRNEQLYSSPTHTHWHTHTHPLTALFGTTQVSRYQKGKTNLDFTKARDSEWQWHQPGHMQVCTSLQTDNHASTPPLSFFTGRMPFLPPNQQCQSTEGLLWQRKRKCKSGQS